MRGASCTFKNAMSAAMKPDIVGCSKSIMLVKAMMEPKKNCIIESSIPFTFVTNREITRM